VKTDKLSEVSSSVVAGAWHSVHCVGVSRSVAVCMQRSDDHRRAVKPSYCENLDKPDDRVKYCNAQPCPPKWAFITSSFYCSNYWVFCSLFTELCNDRPVVQSENVDLHACANWCWQFLVEMLRRQWGIKDRRTELCKWAQPSDAWAAHQDVYDVVASQQGGCVDSRQWDAFHPMNIQNDTSSRFYNRLQGVYCAVVDRSFQFAIRIDSIRFDSLCESIRIDSFCKKIGLSIH